MFRKVNSQPGTVANYLGLLGDLVSEKKEERRNDGIEKKIKKKTSSFSFTPICVSHTTL